MKPEFKYLPDVWRVYHFVNLKFTVVRAAPFPPFFLSTRVCDASSLLFPPPPSLLPTGWKRILRKLFPDLSSKARDRFERNRYISMMTHPLFLLPCLPRAEKRKIWRRRESLSSLPPPLGFGGRIFFQSKSKIDESFFFLLFFHPLPLPSMAKISVTDSASQA